MTRKEHLKFCKKCLNRKFDARQGLICNITQKIADFEEECENFKLDETVKEEEINQEEVIPAEEVVQELNEETINNLKYYQDFYYAIIGGLLTAFVSAVIWAAITVATEYQIGYMAIGVGLLVGFSVQYFGAGIDKKFGYLGAALSLLGCLLGNLFSQVGFIARAESLGYIETLSYLNFGIIGTIMAESFSPMDLFFYAIAVYEGYKFGFRKITIDMLNRLQKGEYDGRPVNQKLRMPLVVGSILILALFIFKVNQGVNGLKTYYYESGKKMSEGEMKKSEEQGKWTYWYENGNIQLVGYYNDGAPDSTWEWYSEEGKLTQQGHYKNGMEHGTWINFYANGNVSDSGLYSETRSQGLWKYWYESGNIYQVGYYDRNLQDSIWTTYFENGQISSIGKYRNGEHVGEWEIYFKNGQLAEELNYKPQDDFEVKNCWDMSGKQLVKEGNGVYKSYSDDGKLLLTGKITNRKRTGKWNTYFDNGDLKEEGIFEGDIYKVFNCWDSTGNQYITKGFGTYATYYPEGTLLEKGEIIKGLREGSWAMYYPSGEKSSEYEYKNGKLNGTQTFYFESGTIYCSGGFIDELRQGEWAWYHENGNLSSKVSFKDNLKDGKQVMWNELGDKVKEEYYKDGELVEEKIL